MKKEKQVVNVTKQELVNVLKNITLNQWVNLVTLTVPNMNKTGNPFYNKELKDFTVRKLTSTNYRTSNYGVRVNKNMDRENIDGDFVPQKPSGKTHVENTECLLVSDKNPNVFYLMVERVEKQTPTVEFFQNGEKMNELDVQILKTWINVPQPNTSQPQDKKVSVITPLLSNIKSVTTDHIQYIVE